MTPLERRHAAIEATMSKFRDQPFEWGQVDCARVAAFHLKQLGYKIAISKAGRYGFVKKNVIDSMAIVNAIEVRHIEGAIIAKADNGSPIFGAPYKEGRMFFSRSLISGRREVKGDAIPGCKSRLFVNLLGGVMPINIADTLDELDGTDADDAPVAAPIPMPLPPEGA